MTNNGYKIQVKFIFIIRNLGARYLGKTSKKKTNDIQLNGAENRLKRGLRKILTHFKFYPNVKNDPIQIYKYHYSMHDENLNFKFPSPTLLTCDYTHWNKNNKEGER